MTRQAKALARVAQPADHLHAAPDGSRPICREASGPVVGLAQPADELCVQPAGIADPNAMGGHAARRPKPIGRRLARQVDAHLELAGGRPDLAELLAPSQADIRLLGGQLDVVAEAANRGDDCFVRRPQRGMAAVYCAAISWSSLGAPPASASRALMTMRLALP